MQTEQLFIRQSLHACVLGREDAVVKFCCLKSFNLNHHKDRLLDKWIVQLTGWVRMLLTPSREKERILARSIHWLSFFAEHKNVTQLILSNLWQYFYCYNTLLTNYAGMDFETELKA